MPDAATIYWARGIAAILTVTVQSATTVMVAIFASSYKGDAQSYCSGCFPFCYTTGQRLLLEV